MPPDQAPADTTQAVIPETTAPAPEKDPSAPPPEKPSHRDEAIAALKAFNAGDGEDETEKPKADAAKTAEADKPEEKKPDEKKPDETKPLDREGRVSLVKQALAGLSEQEAAEFLGASNEAFASLTHKRQQIAKREADHEREVASHASEREEFEGVRREFDEALLRGRNDPDFALSLFGWDADSIKAWAAAGGKRAPDVERVEKQLSEVEQRIRAELEEKERKRTEEAEAAKAEANMRAWDAQIWENISKVNDQDHPHIIRYAEAAKADGEDIREQLFNDVRAVQIAAQEGRLLNLQTGKQVDPTVIDEALALRYIEKRLERQSRRLVGAANPNPVQSGTVKSGDSEGSKKPEPSVTPTNGADAKAAAREEAKRLLREVRAGS